MNFFETVKLNEAIKEIEKRRERIDDVEEIELEKSLGKILGRDIYSKIDIPSFNRSTVDGYAVNTKDIFGASEFSPVPLELQGEILMGEGEEIVLKRGKCVYVPTGGMVPSGADSIVMIENSEKLGEDILINKGTSSLENIILKGIEVKKDEKIIEGNERITSSHIGVLASLGYSKVYVKKDIKFSIISTGDEIVEVGRDIKLGEVYDINTHAFRSLVEEGVGEVVKTYLVRDDLELLKKALKEAVETSDIVLISGGSSVGMKDFTEKTIEEIGGDVFIHGIAVKPGKPTIVATYENKFIFGMPGHPQSAVNVFKALIEPIFLNRKRRVLIGRLQENVFGDPGKTCFINVKISYENNELKVVPYQSKSSMIRPVLDSDGYIKVPEHKEGLYSGEYVEVILNHG